MEEGILHLDGDAFFASCEQARNPALVGKPIAIGKERGIATAFSYEAKAAGVKRGMPSYLVKKVCPDIVFIPSDYATYSLFSQRFISIVSAYSSCVEKYSIDECFALFPLSQAPALIRKLQQHLHSWLGVSFSAGLAPTKVLAKIASRWQKPCGFTEIDAAKIPLFLQHLPIEKVWGIGPKTAATLRKKGCFTALDFAQKEGSWVQTHLSSPYMAIWLELNGQKAFPLKEKGRERESLQRFRTFSPTNDALFLESQFCSHIEALCAKMRRLKIAAQRIGFILRSQDFEHFHDDVLLPAASNADPCFIAALRRLFSKLYCPQRDYRACGVYVRQLQTQSQLDLFTSDTKAQKQCQLLDQVNQRWGPGSLFLGANLGAQKALKTEEGGSLKLYFPFLLGEN
jgi:DNA polymerase-4/DNA polymerase V